MTPRRRAGGPSWGRAWSRARITQRSCRSIGPSRSARRHSATSFRRVWQRSSPASGPPSTT
eukprot:14180882-Alexandrium_andersonii.AAC.1